MLYSTLIIAASAFAGIASAQNTSSTAVPCCSVPVANVPENQKESWCSANQNTCVQLCGGEGNIGSNGNTCTPDTLTYDCKCQNGTDISSKLAAYQQTVPGQMCLFWYEACINATGTDASAQYQCIQTRNTQCGNETTDGTSSSSSSATSSGSGSASKTSGSGSSSSATSAAPSAAKSGGAGVKNVAFYGTPALVGGLLALFGFAL